MIDEGSWSTKSDIFSLGVTMMNLLLGDEWNWVDQTSEEVRRTFQTTWIKWLL
jgi:hypothetical protein